MAQDRVWWPGPRRWAIPGARPKKGRFVDGRLCVGEVRVESVGSSERPIMVRFAYTRGEGRETGVVDSEQLTRSQAAYLYERLGNLLRLSDRPGHRRLT
jgi:hypothetical protein